MTLKLILALLTIGLVGCMGDDKPKPKPALAYIGSVPISGWVLSYSDHAGGVSWNKTGTVNFPVEKNPARCAKKKHTCPSAHYYWKTVSGKIKDGAQMYANFTITAPSVKSWNYKLEPTNTCNDPAKASFIVQKKGDDMRATNGRFWAKSGRVTLNHGKHLMYVKMKRENFINVYGKTPSSSAWASMLANPGRVGITYGGGCFYGHGVNVTGGPAKFKLSSFRFK